MCPEKCLLKYYKNRLANNSIDTTLPPPSLDARTVMQHLFQLIEWVYRLDLPNKTSLADALVAVREFYTQSLDWYQDFFTILKQDSNRTPLIVFAQCVDDNRITISSMILTKLIIPSVACTITLVFSVHFDHSSRNA